MKFLLHSLVQCEKILKRDRVQCKRCQRIGHIVLNCNLEYRCVKCNFQYNPEECTRTDQYVDKPYCVNCKSFGHHSSYRACPRLEELKQKIEDRKPLTKIERDKKQPLMNKTINPVISYSAMLSGKQTQTHTVRTQPLMAMQTYPRKTS